MWGLGSGCRGGRMVFGLRGLRFRFRVLGFRIFSFSKGLGFRV